MFLSSPAQVKALCKDCVVERCRILRLKNQLNEDYKTVTNLLKVTVKGYVSPGAAKHPLVGLGFFWKCLNSFFLQISPFGLHRRTERLGVAQRCCLSPQERWLLGGEGVLAELASVGSGAIKRARRRCGAQQRENERKRTKQR